MTIVGDVLKELLKMFVADLRLTLGLLSGVMVVAVLLKTALVGPVAAGLLLAFFCLAVLAEAVLREARTRGRV